MQKIHRGYSAWEKSKAEGWCIIETQRRTDGARFLAHRHATIQRLMEYAPGSETLTDEEFQEACKIAWIQKMILGDDTTLIPQYDCKSFSELRAKSVVI